jgi:hypothetical protein
VKSVERESATELGEFSKEFTSRIDKLQEQVTRTCRPTEQASSSNEQAPSSDVSAGADQSPCNAGLPACRGNELPQSLGSMSGERMNQCARIM